MRRTRTILRTAAAAVLPLALAGGSAVIPAGATTTFGGGWAGRWLTTATGSTAGTSLKDVRT